VALDLGEHLLVLDYDPAEEMTVVAVGGPAPARAATWLAQQLDDLGRPVSVLPPPAHDPVVTAV
jgi:hypothetical protein